ncbi:profilin [Aspergillus pseudoustus]|uniref:Profilin n=1 Tax=Aspergillus pseudoustus TaxID=1810923 RepID=A0ABR4K5W8_9EURO
MDWNSILDARLLQTGKIDHAAIIALDGSSVLANSPDFTILPNEIQHITAALRDRSAFDSLMGTGIRANGDKYFYVDGNFSEGYVAAKHEANGVFIARTNTAALVVHFSAPYQGAEVASIVFPLADEVRDSGY